MPDQNFPIAARRLVAVALAGIAAALGATAAQADNDNYSLLARACTPYKTNGCEVASSQQPLANGLSADGAYSFASGYRGG